MARAHPLRDAAPLALDVDEVRECLDTTEPLDRTFHLAWTQTLDAIPRAHRGGALAGITGHIAESVVELILVERGYAPVAHHPGPGRHGVDLLMLHLASEMLFAVEVKGTLRAGTVPRLTRGDLVQMSDTWVDKPDNPAMTGAALRSEDVYGAVVAVNFADMSLRFAMSRDFVTFTPLSSISALDDPSWLRTH